jgi:hypothetical protein
MARKKPRPDETAENGAPMNGAAVATPPTETPAPHESNGPPVAESATRESVATPAGSNRPAASFAAHSDRTTCLEVAVWSRPVKVSESEEYVQFALTFSRSWRDKDGKWTTNASYRAHDVPVLLFLIQQAYNYCLNARTEVRIGNEPVPF